MSAHGLEALDLIALSGPGVPPTLAERLPPPLLDLHRRAAEAGLWDSSDAFLFCDLLELSGYTALDDSALPLHALLISMFDALQEGSLCLRIDGSTLADRLRSWAPDPDTLARRIRESLQAWPRLIGTETAFKPLIHSERNGASLLYFQRHHACERRLEARLTTLLGGDDAPVSQPNQLKSVVRDVLHTAPLLRPDGQPMVLEKLQQAALCLPLLKRCVLISGGPGTGKTTIVTNILRALMRLGVAPRRMLLAAPTGRAAFRMTESLRRALLSVRSEDSAERTLAQLEASTLHRLLQYRPSRHDFVFGRHNPLDADVIVIDEVSMVDAGLMSQLLEAVPDTARLILLGDREQLPSVDAGAVLADLLPEQFATGFSPALSKRINELCGVSLPLPKRRTPLQDSAVMLEKNQRMDEEIRNAAAHIRNGRWQAVLDAARPLAFTGAHWPNPNREGRFHWLSAEQLSVPMWREILERWGHEHYLDAGTENFPALVERAAMLPLFETAESLATPEAHAALEKIFARLTRAQILTLIRRGPFGCDDINLRLSMVLRRRLDPAARGDAFAGLPILITRNDYGLNIFNGDSGIVLKDNAGRYRAVLARLRWNGTSLVRAFVAYPLDALFAAWEPAYALTVHKSQGSEYDRVLLVAPPEQPDAALPARRMLKRELLYTGLTRARHAMTLCGTKTVLKLAVENKIERFSGLQLGNLTADQERSGSLFDV